MTIGETIARTKRLVKGIKQDSILTDRFVYSIWQKYMKQLLRRQDGLNRLMKFNSTFQVLGFVELVEVDKVEANCEGIKSGCTIKRTKKPIHTFMEGYWGPLVRNITSIDGSVSIQPTYPSIYVSKTNQKNFKYNKSRYYWFLNGYFYFPDLDWDAVRIEAMLDDDPSNYTCGHEDVRVCTLRQDQQYYVPEDLQAEIESMVLKDLTFTMQVPSDNNDDKTNILRP